MAFGPLWTRKAHETTGDFGAVAFIDGIHDPEQLSGAPSPASALGPLQDGIQLWLGEQAEDVGTVLVAQCRAKYGQSGDEVQKAIGVMER